MNTNEKLHLHERRTGERRRGNGKNAPSYESRFGTEKDFVSEGGIEDQLRNLLDAIEAVRRGDLTQRLRKGRYDIFAEIADSYNGLMESLGTFTSEVTRVSREVGTEGKLGGQAQVPGVAGTWKELTENVNAMATNLTTQVRNIAQVSTAVANGDLAQKITVDVRGEVLQLKETINKIDYETKDRS